MENGSTISEEFSVSSIFDIFETLIVGAMSMIAALAWNEAFMSIF